MEDVNGNSTGVVKTNADYIGRCTRKGRVIQDKLRELGSTATFERLLRILPNGVTCIEQTFYEHYRRLFGPKSTQSKQMEEITNVKVDPDDEDEDDDDDGDVYCPTVDSQINATQLSSFMRFALVVEAIGGVAKARRLLDKMEELSKILGG